MIVNLLVFVSNKHIEGILFVIIKGVFPSGSKGGVIVFVLLYPTLKTPKLVDGRLEYFGGSFFTENL